MEASSEVPTFRKKHSSETYSLSREYNEQNSVVSVNFSNNSGLTTKTSIQRCGETI